MTRDEIIKKSVVTLAAAAVLFAITSNVAEAAKVNPNPMGKPSTGGTVFEKTDGCMIAHSQCLIGDYTSGDVKGCRSGKKGKGCRIARQKVRCKYVYKKCKKKKEKAKKTLPPSTGTIMNTVPMKQYKMTPMKQK